ncbi:EF-hand domain-containing protein [Rhabdochromatium marinum]|uniref:EF-hand domain-containing protein n=1 Tax=Rhabdochromatium marinum TaxID=48729 RepID=UPI0019033B57|nr:EF-hand domain-containing protein [Rhabdochromatium marinum]MBK1648937.1 hypothetical protein [Rhabdochromatium marinum]
MRIHALTPALLPLLLTTVLGAGHALAEEPAAPSRATPTEAFMQELDKNQDSQVSLDEVKAPQAARFAETDADGNGSISTDEARAAFAKQVPPEMLKQMRERGMPDPGDTFIKNLDTDDDQSVSEEEFVQPAVESFGRMDANSDGLADADEVTAFFDAMQQEMQKRMEEMQRQHQQMTPPAQQ